MLTIDEIRKLIAMLGREVVVPESDDFPYQVTRKVSGYAPGESGQLQAKLSIMLQAAAG